MAGDIFYSQVDANLQKELRERARAGATDKTRTTKYMNYMLEKIANVEMVAYADNERKQVLTDSIIGGLQQQGGSFLPSGPIGFLTDRKYRVIDNTQPIYNASADPFRPQFVKNVIETDLIDSSARTAPFITSMDISIGDNSNGLLNTADINITIPNPVKDLTFIESIYFRPGRHVSIRIQHPDSAVITNDTTGGFVTEDTMPSIRQLLEIYPDLTVEQYNDLRRMNSAIFNGVIVSFTFDYQKDLSVTATISMKGAAQMLSDISLIMNSNATPKLDHRSFVGSEIPLSLKMTNQRKPATLQSNVTNPFHKPLNTALSANQLIADSKNFDTETYRLKSFYEGLYTNVTNVTNINEIKANTTKTKNKAGIAKLPPSDPNLENECFVIWGTPYKGAEPQNYITLAYLIDYINTVLTSKLAGSANQPTIKCTANGNVCLSNSYEFLISSNPLNVYLHNNTKNYGKLVWLEDAKKTDTTKLFDACQFSAPNTNSKNSLIFINMDIIQGIVQTLQQSNSFKVSNFLQAISSEIYDATGHAIDMQLITHPDHVQTKDLLLFYDSKYLSFDKTESVSVEPFTIPMSIGNAGTLVRDFKFSAKLPEDASSLAYVLNQDPSEISESDIAPYVNYMYTANSVTRSKTADGIFETRGNLKNDAQIKQIEKKYADTYKKYNKQLIESIAEFGANPANIEKRAGMADALQKYIQFPKETIQASNQITAPIIPFDVEFTIDGVNGFRYGDVLTFSVLPDRYVVDTVFSIVNVTHNVDTAGMWTTTIRCIMRPKIDK